MHASKGHFAFFLLDFFLFDFASPDIRQYNLPPIPKPHSEQTATLSRIVGHNKQHNMGKWNTWECFAWDIQRFLQPPMGYLQDSISKKRLSRYMGLGPKYSRGDEHCR
jgi:hypothetical protein